VDPGKKGLRALPDPGGRGPDDIFGAALGAFGRIAGGFLSVTIIVGVEAAVQAEPRVQDERPDEGARPVAGRFEHGRQRGQARAETEQPVGAKAVHRRRDGGQDRGVRGKRQRHGAVGTRQTETAGRERVEIGGQTPAPAECADTIDAQRVDRDQQHVAAAARPRDERRRRPSPPQPTADQNHDDQRRTRRNRRKRSGSACSAGSALSVVIRRHAF
jgi:hypothetical protein